MAIARIQEQVPTYTKKTMCCHSDCEWNVTSSEIWELSAVDTCIAEWDILTISNTVLLLK